MNNGKIVVFGSSNTDMTVKTDRLPVPGETVIGGVFTIGPGGKGANQAVAAARLGGNVSLVCKVGDDVFGHNAVSHYKDEGIDTDGILTSSKPSGVALITVDAEAENCIVVAPGANMDISLEDVERSAGLIRRADILLLQLEIPVPAVLRAAQIAFEAGVQVVLNPAPYAPLPDEIFKYISVFTPNETELAAFSGVPAGDEESVVRACEVMIGKGVGRMIVTLGSKGSLIYDGGTTERIAATRVEAVDTTGAGDTFSGALCVALSEGRSLADAARFASKASALSVTKLGAQEAMPFRADMD